MLDLTEKQLTEKDGSTVVMKNASFKRDHVTKYFEYKVLYESVSNRLRNIA